MGKLTNLNKTQVEMLKQMYSWGAEYYYSYDWFEGIDKKTLKREMKGLIEIGVSKFCRGGINDDGELTGGSGFTIPYNKRSEVKEFLNTRLSELRREIGG